MSIDILPLIDLGTISFHTGVKSSPFNDGLPNTAPFNVGLRSYVNLLVQVPYADVSRYLAKAYEKGSMIGTPMSEVGVGRKYTEDFLEFILKNVNLQNEDRPRILEIGCGTGYLLYRLKRLGLRVLGIEPGEQGQTGSLKYDLEIIQDTFPGKMIGYGERFELIIHYGVLEHIENPVTFLQKQAEYLSEYGSTIFAVPNCQEYILSGNISMFVHEHWNYFTPYSLNKVIEKAGMKLLRLESARYGGAIYGIAGKTGQAIDIAEEFNWP
ncbi:MAG: class I SAM-dependent methyltransferase, partial [Desulfobacterales bacterium]|nr:class I SAM-dependent methyltransferase [Desulfobacterales bacterium]